MNFRYTAAALAVLALGSAHADDGPSWKFSGFGTLSAVHSSERQADFVGTAPQPNGAGFTRPTSFNPDSKLGAQLTATLTDKFSAVVQLVAQHQYDNSYMPEVEWANVKYQWSPEVSVRVGRIAAPTFMVSETRLVGYANPYVRPPKEVYGMNPITSNDGVDATYRSAFGGAYNTAQAYYGRRKIQLFGDGSVQSTPTWGINDSVEVGSLTLRAAYTANRLKVDIAGVNGLIVGLNQFSAGVAAVPVPTYQAAAAQAAALAQRYEPEGIKSQAFAFAASYDTGTWFLTGELSFLRFSDSLFSNSQGWYAGGGYRFGNVTPYATFSNVKGTVKAEAGISTAGLDAQTAGGAAALNGGINTAISNFSFTQSSVALGVRWDFMPNVALKAQYDRERIGAGSSGFLGNVQPGFVSGGTVNLVTVALDFVF